MENEIIKKFREGVKEICYKQGATSVQDYAEQFILSELKALKEDCLQEWVMKECDTDKETGEIEEWKKDFLLGYNNHLGLTKKAFAKRGV